MTEKILFHFTVPDEAQGERIDRFLSAQFEHYSRSYIQGLIKQGHVTKCYATEDSDQNSEHSLKEQISEAKYRIKANDTFAITIPEPKELDVQPETIPLNVVYEDTCLIVIDKQPGLTVHPGPGNWTGTLVNALLAHCGDNLSGIGGVLRPGIVHRIDKETSGLIVVAKSDQAHKALAEQFAAHGKDGRLVRAYTAFIWGTLNSQKGKIDAAIGRHPTNRQKMAVVKQGGKHAVTYYQIEHIFKNLEGQSVVSQVKCHLETGRTHQIRVHLAHVGHPLLADPVYGAGFAKSINKLTEPCQKAVTQLKRQALHATTLGFEHPQTKAPILFESPLCPDIDEVRVALSNMNHRKN
ncbi:MAG: RluA family pseudouridine synthase [Pseudomonadota bacterium]